jgi:hypothetical protein
MILATPVVIPIAVLLHWRDQRRLRKAALKQACPTCHRQLGVESLVKANEELASEVAELRKSHPGVRFRIVRTMDAIRMNCGARLRFRKEFRDFVVTDRDLIVPSAFVARSEAANRTISNQS